MLINEIEVSHSAQESVKQVFNEEPQRSQIRFGQLVELRKGVEFEGDCQDTVSILHQSPHSIPPPSSGHLSLKQIE